jgi:hypothetical protein
MQALSWKLLLFYITTIGLVVALFNWVSNYGETQLQAQPKITGRYRIQAQDLPNCLQRSLLEIQQSGQFLNGLILPESAVQADGLAEAPIIRQRAMLQGSWQGLGQGEMALTGTDRQVGNCFVTLVQLKATIKPGSKSSSKSIVGMIRLNRGDQAAPASLMGYPTYNNGNVQTLTFQAQKITDLSPVK